MRVSYADGYYAPIPREHIFPMGKFPGLHRYLLKHGILKKDDIVTPSPADLSDLMLVHSSAYVYDMNNGSLSEKAVRKLGLPWSRALAKRSRLAVKGTINTAIMALQDGIAGNLAGGTHHAMAGHGEGFCVYNDVAVAINVLQRAFWARKILIIDCDVHQGNGTARLLADNPDVFTFSLHGENNYPFRKPPSSLDIGLPDGTSDKNYLATLQTALETVFKRFDPDLVFYLGGIDPLQIDRLGRLTLTKEGLFKRDRMVIKSVIKENKPLALLLSGGYAPTLKQTVEAHALMYRAAKEVWG